MTQVTFDITTSLDGFVAGPNRTPEEPLGRGGTQLHEWAVGTASWRERHGLEGGETNADSDVIAESLARQGALVMGRRMFSGGEGPWEGDDNRHGWWGDDPPFRMPVFVLTHHPRETVELPNGTIFTFVTDGIESALARARAAAGDKDVVVVGGANVVQQFLAAGLVDEFQLHIAPVLLGDGVRLFDGLGSPPSELELTSLVESPAVTHLSYRVLR